METKNGLPHEDLLRLASLGEVFGGFAHEIAQPLNAIMIASQVVQLKVERSSLTEEEKAFIVHRLKIVASQVQKASEIVDSLRVFSGANFSGFSETGLKKIFDKIHGLMGQQFISRSIELKWECDEALPPIGHNPNLVEGIIVQGLAFARDAVAAIGVWHDQRGIPYKKFLTVRCSELGGACAADIMWPSGAFPSDMSVMDVQNHIGLATAGKILSSIGGRLETTASTLRITFP
jgi:nitrogen fixation/metabolism regulation signal transduction histidine kinase